MFRRLSAAAVAVLFGAAMPAHAQDQKHRAKDLTGVYVVGLVPPSFSPPPPRFGSGGNISGYFGAGGLHTQNNKQPTADKTKSKQPCPNFQGDPVSLENGYKIDSAIDFSLPGEMGLKFERFYVSKNVQGTAYGGWTNNLDYKLSCPTSKNCNTLTFRRPDGSELSFVSNGDNTFSEIGGGYSASATYSPAGMVGEPSYYTVYDEDSRIYTWSQGPNSNVIMLKYISDVNGMLWTISRSGSTTTVKHTNGQVMTLTTSTEGNLSVLTVTDPMGSAYTYKSLPNAPMSVGVLPLALGTVILPGAPTTTIGYKYAVGLSNALSEVDYNGVPHDFTDYDSSGRVQQTRLADGSQATTIAYGSNGAGATATVTNALGHVSVYQFNQKGQLSSITGQAADHCAATFSEIHYDAEGNLSSSTDNNGNVTKYTYAPTGQLMKKEEASGSASARTTSYVWDTLFGIDRVLSVTVEGLSKTSYTYNAQNRIASQTVVNLSSTGIPNQALTTSYQYTLYSSGMVHTVSVVHPSPNQSNVDTFTYDALGNLISATDALGHAATYSNYTALGRPGRVVGPNGNRVDYGYDARGRMTTRTTYPGGIATAWVYAYDGFGLLSSVTGPDNQVTATARNAETQVTSVTHNDKDGSSTETFDYDANGGVTTHAIARGGDIGKKETVIYDKLGRPYQRQGMHGQVSTYAYDTNDNVTSITDALGHAVAYQYDALNRISQSTDPSGGITKYAYDLADRVIAVTDPRGLVTSYGYDGLGQLWQQASPDTGTTTFTYDVYGRRASMTRADGVQTTYGYDALDRPTSASAGGLNQWVAYDSCTNGLGRVCSVSDTNGTTSYGYTPEGWLTSRGFSINGITYALGYGYNPLGQVVSVTYPDGNSATYNYIRGVVADITFTAAGSTSNVATAVSYRPGDMAMTSWISGNGLTNTLAYDTDGRLVGIDVPSVQSLALGYDGADRVSQITNGIDGTMTQSFSYDALSRLTSVASAARNESYQYDATGNRVGQTVNGVTTPGAISPASNRLTAFGASALGYDANGNMTTVAGVPTYHYDAFNRMDSAAGTSYYVNPEGQRLRKAGGAGTTYFAPDQSNALLAEYSGSWVDYVWLNGRLVGRVEGGQLYAVHGDQVGRPEAVTNAAKAIVWRAQNFAFGQHVTTAGIVFNLGFPGQYYDAETGLWNNGFRDYSSALGRYVQSDPIGLAGGVNTYVYVGGNPVSRIDVLGMKLCRVNLLGGSYLVDQSIAGDLISFVDEITKAGISTTFNYVFRTTEEQTGLWNRRSSNPNPVARPGTSRHESGFAFDINVGRLNSSQLQQLISIASQNGFFRLPSGKDPPHFEADPLKHGYESRISAIRENQADAGTSCECQ